MNQRSRYEAPIAPDIDVMKASAMEAFPVAIVGFAVAYSVAKVYSVKHDYTIDGNQVSQHTGRTKSFSTGRTRSVSNHAGRTRFMSRQEEPG